MNQIKFELSRLARGCSDNEVIEEIRRVSNLINSPIMTRRAFDELSKIHSTTLIRRFGSWEKTLINAGLGNRYSGRSITKKMIEQKAKHMTDAQLISELKNIAKKLNKKSITQEDFNKNSSLSAATLTRRFGSWKAALEKAGLTISTYYRRRYSDEEFFENLLNVWTHHGRQPYYRNMNEPPSNISAGGYEYRFGSWRKALEAFITYVNQEEDSSVEKEKRSHQAWSESTLSENNHKEPLKMTHKTPRSPSWRLRFLVFRRDNFKCCSCGRSPANTGGVILHIDHKKPWSDGGETVIENLQTLCEECNIGKSNLPQHEKV